MNNVTCQHIDEDGSGALLFPKYTYKAISERKYCGVCSICGEIVIVSEEEYKKYGKEK